MGRALVALLAVLAWTAGGCGAPGASGGDPGEDAATDPGTWPDAGPGAGDDGRPDGAPDATVDSGVDAAYDEGPETEPCRVFAASATPIPDLAVAARVRVARGRGGAGVSVVSRDPDGAGVATPVLPLAPGIATVEFPVLGLTPSSRNDLEVRLHDARGDVVCTTVTDVTTAALPDPFPSLEVLLDEGATVDYVSMSIVHKSLFEDSIGVLVDRTGRVMWYRAIPTLSVHGINFARQPNGYFTVFEGCESGFGEYELDGTLRRHIVDTAALPGTNGHDLLVTADNWTYMLGYQQMGPGETMRNSLDVFDPQGRLAWQWLEPPDHEQPDGHPNSLALAADGDVVLSMNFAARVWKIRPEDGTVAWTLSYDPGGLEVRDDPLAPLGGMHDVNLTDDGHVMGFENGIERIECSSRAVEYAIDAEAGTATLVWEYRHPEGACCHIGGSARRLPGGNTLIDWSVQSTVDEVTPDGTPVWRLKTKSFGIYRALPQAGLYPAGYTPPAAPGP